MKKLILLAVPLFCFTAFSAHAATEVEDWLSDLEMWINDSAVEEREPTTQPRVLADTSQYRSRWGQRQSQYRKLAGRRAQSNNDKSYFSLRKDRQTRDAEEVREQRPRRTSSRQTKFQATSAKARLLQQEQRDRSLLKPQRFSARTAPAQEVDTISPLEAFDLDALLEELLK